MSCTHSRLLTLALVASLMGCAAQTEPDQRGVEARLRDALNQNARCEAWLQNKEVYQRLTSIMAFEVSGAETKLHIDRHARDEEKRDLLTLNNLTAECRKRNLENFGDLHPEFVTLAARWFAQDDAVLLQLLRDEITLGQANRALVTSREQRAASSQNAAATITRELEAAGHPTADLESANRALQRWYREQALLLEYQRDIGVPERAPLTNCYYRGQRVICETY
jgi:hypothetical protein